MNKLTDSNLSKLSEYFQSHREKRKSALFLKIKFSTNKRQNPQIIRLIEEELSLLTHLTDLDLVITHHSILTAEGYSILSNTILNLSAIKRLSLTISSNCFLENEGLSILKEMINKLSELVYLKFEIHESNYVTAEAVQEFLDSLARNTKMTTLKLMFKGIKNSLTNEENIQFWRGLTNQINLENLKICVQTHNYVFSDLVELFAYITHLNKLRKLDLILFIEFSEDTHLLDELFAQIGKMLQLRSLKINIPNRKSILNDQQRKTILRNLSNLKLLEKLELKQLEKILLKENFVEYANMIKDTKYLKALSWDTTNSLMKTNQKICILGQSLLELNNLLNLDLVLELGDDSFQKIFFSDLSVSFSQMHNLISLTLEFENRKISEVGCSILEESFMHLQRLEKFDLKLSLPETMQTRLFHSIRKMSNLKKFVIKTKYKHTDEEDVMLFGSVAQLQKLETLHFGDYFFFTCDKNGVKKLIQLREVFLKLRNLKSLQIECLFASQDSKSWMNIIKKCFENLQTLEYLKLSLSIIKNKEDLQYESIIDNLANLKRIEISFNHEYWNIFGTSAKSNKNLEYCSIITYKIKIEVKDFLQIFESISQLKIKKLNLDISVDNLTIGHDDDQFEAVCSKLTSLEKLSFTDNTYSNNNLMIYIKGIKQIKQLKSLKLVSNSKSILTQQDIQVFESSLKDLKNLQKLRVKSNSVVLIHDDIQLKSFQTFGNLKYFQFQIQLQVEDEIMTKSIEVKSACTLDEETLKYHRIDAADQILTPTDKEQNLNVIQLKQQKLSSEDQLKNVESLKAETDSDKEFNPTDLQIDLKVFNSKDLTMILNEFDFQNSKYLNKLDISAFYKKNPVQLELLSPLKDLKYERKLESLTIKLDNIVLNEEQISYFSRNFKFLTNLKSFKFQTNCSKDYYILFFDSFQWLSNLISLSFLTKISESETISLGNSTLNQECLCSIFNGLKQTTRLKELALELNTEEIIDGEDHSIPISECISNLKQLIVLKFFLLGNIQINSIRLRDFFTQVGSLVHLDIMQLDINEKNPFNQEMLEELIRALNKLTVLNYKNISIYLDTNKPIKISQDFATLFNLNPSCSELCIETRDDDDSMICKQSECFFRFKWKHLKNLEIDFLEYLNKNTIVIITIGEVKTIQYFTMCSVRKISLYFSALVNDQDIEITCGFLEKIKNIFDLQINVDLDSIDNLDQQKHLRSISETLTKLESLRVLCMRITPAFEIPFEKLMELLNTLKKLKHLSELNLSTQNDEIDLQLIPKIQRAILRLVILDEDKMLAW